MAGDLKPRLCQMTKGDSGYGFHLHGEKGKSGQYIRKVEPNSPAEASGLRAGDRVVEVNGESVERETHHQPPWSCCSLCHLCVCGGGADFNLHSEKSRPGQYIRSLDPGSPADRAGLRLQDRLIEVNGVNIENMRHAEVVAFIKSVGAEARLLVVDPDTDDHFKRMGLTPTSSHVRDFEAQSITNGSPSPRINGSSTSHSTHLRSQQIPAHYTTECVYGESMSEGSSGSRLLDPFAEIGLRLSQTAAEAREKAHAKRAKKRAPQMDWSQKYELFSNF
ncbi:Na(+)/H(+) exchange regulatory cofactor NHE-RF2-like [Alosa alosa]|uniref:Na(+)/H(+) exchange regulatory cofactor NHE-RF2-like n=1 Tax=Alosa alosa TaxID=278164 RepID=UPI00201509A2|nr:Na(+)/H(+) exchange regulatory cofactor NHE-RF2-like [Alosa alosa]